MENKISFAEFIKNEIIEFNWKDEQLDILFYSFLKTNGNFVDDKFTVGSSLKNHKKLFRKLFKKYYNVEPEVGELETKIKFIINDKEFKNEFFNKENSLVLDTDEKCMAFVAGAFIGKGWISRPSSRFYHMEFRVGSMAHSLNLQESIDSLGVKTTTIIKNNWFITYIKKSLSLSDLLKAMHAYQAMMIFEEERINRDFTSSYSKMESIEAYNYEKIVAVSKIQVKAINKLMKSKIWKTIKKDWTNLAELRIEKPNYSLSDLQYTFNSMYEKDVSKSTINNWLNSIVDLADIEVGD